MFSRFSHEPSTKQFKKAIHIKSLGTWATNESVLSKSLIDKALEHAPMLKHLGYAQVGFPPDYTKLPEKLPSVI